MHERRHAGERRSGEAQLRAILDGSLDAVVSMDARGRIIFWNPQAERLFGWSRDEAIGRLLGDLIVPHSLRDAHARGLEHYLATGEGLLLGRVVEVMAMRRDGREIPVELAVTDVKKAGHHSFTAFIRDVSERKKGEENSRLLVETSHNLELLSTLSHELRTPLTAIVGWAYLLRMGGLDEPTARRALDTIERNAKAQAQKISDILDVSKIATGKLRLNLRAMDLPVTIVAAVDAAMPAANAKGIHVQTVLDPTAGPVWGDPDRLQQVVWNLLSNSVKFTPPGGTVHVRLARRDSHAAITIEDTGTGIRADFLPHVFERFRQGDETSTRAHGGMGLGLAVVRYLVEMHGGSVSVSSPGTGKGAAFTVTLPLAAAGVREGVGAPPQALAESPLQEDAFADAPRLDGVRVLVCVRDADDREAMAAALKKSGADVTAVGSSEEALKTMAQKPAQVLLSEVDAPSGDGYALLRAVRTLPAERGGHVPAAAVMTYGRSEDRIRALREGFQLYMSKPVHPAELITVVASLAERPPAPAE